MGVHAPLSYFSFGGLSWVSKVLREGEPLHERSLIPGSQLLPIPMIFSGTKPARSAFSLKSSPPLSSSKPRSAGRLAQPGDAGPGSCKELSWAGGLDAQSRGALGPQLSVTTPQLARTLWLRTSSGAAYKFDGTRSSLKFYFTKQNELKMH